MIWSAVMNSRPPTAGPGGPRLAVPRVLESALFLLLASGPPRFRARDPFDSMVGEIDSVIVLNALVWAAGALWIGFQLARRVVVGVSLPELRREQILALVLVVALLLSAVVSPAPMLTIYRVCQIAISVLFGALWLNRFGERSLLIHLLGSCLALSSAIVLAALVMPDLVYTGGRLRGDFVANTGAVAAIGVVLSSSLRSPRSRFLRLGLLVGWGALLLMAMTRAAYAAVLAFVGLAAIRRPQAVWFRALVTSIVVVVPSVLALELGSTIIPWIMRDSESVSTLSDRIPLWQHTLGVTLEESPLIGLGFYANRGVTTEYNPGLGTSHSAFVEVLSGGGLVAGSVFFLLILTLGGRAGRILLSRETTAEAFAAASLLVSVLLLGVVSEEMVIASPTAFAFWSTVSLLSQSRGATLSGASGTFRGARPSQPRHPTGSRGLPGARMDRDHAGR